MPTCTPTDSLSQSTPIARHYVVTIALILLLIFGGDTCAQNDPVSAVPLKQIRFAVLHDIYSDVTRQDARAALELIMQKTIARKSYPYSATIDLMEKSEDIVAAIQKGGYHFVTLSGIDYFSYRDALGLTPVLIPSKSDEPTETLMLLVNKGRTLAAIAREPRRTLILESGRKGDLSRAWLDKVLAERDLPDCDRLFTRIRHVKKPARAVLPVFFDQADACVVTRNALEVIQELNPQIGQRIEALFHSKGLIRRLICATPKPAPEDIDTFVKESVHIDHNADTLQAMTIIQMRRFHYVSDEGLEATRELLFNPAP